MQANGSQEVTLDIKNKKLQVHGNGAFHLVYMLVIVGMCVFIYRAEFSKIHEAHAKMMDIQAQQLTRAADLLMELKELVRIVKDREFQGR